MKRFSKIFCVALIVIIFGIISPNWSLINTASAETKHQTIIKLCETNKNIHTIDVDDLPSGATVADYDGTCYSKIIDLIFNFYNKHFLDAPAKRTDIFSGPNNSIDGSLNIFGICDNVKPAVWAVGCTTYQTFRNAIPDNTNFDLGNTDIDAIKAAIESSKPPIVIVDPDVSPDYYPVNSGTCDETKFSLIQPSTWLPTFNCWIIRLISKVVSWGVQLMSALIEPGKFLGKISTNPAVTVGFSASLELVNIVFSVALVVMAIGTILNLKSYKVNDLITKFIIVALLINFTLVIAGSIIDLANYLSLFFLNLTLKSSGGGGMVTAWNGIFSGLTNLTPTNDDIGILLISILINILLLIALVWAFGSIIFSLLKRGFMLIFLLIISPFAVVASLLPGKGADQWRKWKTAFLKYTFYGVYVSAGLYIGTIMLQSLCLSLQTETLATNPEMGFMSGLMVPIMAAGFLIFIVLLADELAGGSAKAAAEGASKLALSLAGGAALAGAMKAKTALTTSQPFNSTMNKLSTTRGLGWIGNAGLKTREGGLAYRNQEGEVIDKNVGLRDNETNNTRLQALINSGRKDPKTAREIASISQQLFANKKMGKESGILLEQNIGWIVNEKNEKNGWVPKSFKKSLKDSNPSLFIKADLEKDTGMSEDNVITALNNSHGDVIQAAMALAPTASKEKMDTIQKAMNKYLDERIKVGLQFNRYAANANEEVLVKNILDGNAIIQERIMEGLASNPATMRSVMDQVSESGLSTPKKQDVIAAFQKYLDDHGSQYTEKQLHYIDENVSRLSTDTARSRKANKTPVNEALETAFEENAVRTEEIKIEGNIAKQKQMREDRIKTIQDIKESQEITRNRESLEKEIEDARIKRFTAQDEQSAKQHLEELQKKWNDTYGPNHK